MGFHSTTLLERFFAKIDFGPHTSGCHIWIGGKNQQNYGQFNAGGKQFRAHRFCYLTFIGPIPEGMFVCHSCDNPPCVNPDHLWIGTAKDNSDDKFKKGREGNSGRPRTYPDYEASREAAVLRSYKHRKSVEAKYGPRTPRVRSIYQKGNP